MVLRVSSVCRSLGFEPSEVVSLGSLLKSRRLGLLNFRPGQGATRNLPTDDLPQAVLDLEVATSVLAALHSLCVQSGFEPASPWVSGLPGQGLYR